MNRKNRLPRRLLRIIALATALALVLGSMIVFGETVSHDEVNHVLCEHCGGCTTSGCDYSDGVCPGCHKHETADTCEICGGCSHGAHCYSEGSTPCALEDCTHSADDHIYDSELCGTCAACGGRTCEGGCYEPADGEDGYTARTVAVCEGGCVLHTQTCPLCGGCTGGDKCYSSQGVPCTGADCPGTCHFHDDEADCESCETCGGCLCEDAEHCYALNITSMTAEKCTPCGCSEDAGQFAALRENVSLNKTYTSADISGMVANEGSEVIPFVHYIFLTDADGNVICSLSEAIADGAEFSFTATMSPPNSAKHGESITLFPYSDSAHPGPMFSVDFRCVEGASAGDAIPITVALTVEYDGQEISRNFTYTLHIVESALELVSVSGDELELAVGDEERIIFRLIFTGASAEPGEGQILARNTDIVEIVDVRSEENSEFAALDIFVTVEGLKAGTTTVDMTLPYTDGNGESTLTCSVRVDVVPADDDTASDSDVTSDSDAGSDDDDNDTDNDNNDNGESPRLSVTMSSSTIKVGDKVTLTAKGWFNGETFAASDVCYVPISWKINPEGSWDVPSTLTEADLTKTAEISDLSEGTYTPTVTYARMVRNADGTWSASGSPVSTSSTLKVEKKSTGSNNNNSNNSSDKDNNNPQTGDVTLKEYAAMRRAGNIMLGAGIAIIAALSAEQITRILNARKRRADAIRR